MFYKIRYDKKDAIKFDCVFFVWCHQESNRGHKDFQSFALPTELWHHHCFLSQKRMQSYDKFLNYQNIFDKNFSLFWYVLFVSVLDAEFIRKLGCNVFVIGFYLSYIGFDIACWDELFAEFYLFFLEI